MATTQPLISHQLSVDLDEDNMEMATSPYHEIHDDDIDFELDDQREHSIEDNSMIDDTTENLDTNPNQDDMMLYDDDDNDLVDFDQDLPMDPDEPSYIHDQDILEEGEALHVELETHDQNIEDASIEDVNVAINDTKSMNGEGHDGELQEGVTNIETTIMENDATVAATEKNEVDPRDEEIDQVQNAADEEENPIQTQTTDVKDFAVENASEEAYREETQNLPNESAVETSVEPVVTLGVNSPDQQVIEASPTELEEAVEDASDEVETSVEAVTSNSVQKSPQREITPVNLHPVAIRYNGEDCWLFPPFDSTEIKHVFLDDPALASEPFDRLIAALRSNLINNQEMADHDEIVFDIPVLGLHICEDSKHASLLNLSRVIDIYMMLSQNEGLTVFEPLYCELSTRVCLADQFAYVEDAAFVQRITYTDFVAEQTGSPEELPETKERTVQEHEEEEEEPHADISTYYDAADDQDEEEEPLTTATQVQENEGPIEDLTKPDLTQPSRFEAEVETFEDDFSKEESAAYVDKVFDRAGSPSKLDIDEATLITEVENGLQNEQEQSNGNDDELQDEQDEASQKQADQVPSQAEPEADEDLFADDPVEPEIQETESGKTSQAPETNSNGPHQNLENVEDNDDFDFDDWSDDEQDITKTESVVNQLSTPSNSGNSKRKLIDEDDDFLDIDVSTPEPKRSRQS